jgi:hypothetical protein
MQINSIRDSQDHKGEEKGLGDKVRGWAQIVSQQHEDVTSGVAIPALGMTRPVYLQLREGSQSRHLKLLSNVDSFEVCESELFGNTATKCKHSSAKTVVAYRHSLNIGKQNIMHI